MVLRCTQIVMAIAFFPAVLGLNNERKELLVKSYDKSRTAAEIREEYFRILSTNPCLFLLEKIVELKDINPDRIRVTNEVQLGDTVENNGYRLIVNETLTVDIPAVIKCIPKYKNNTSVKYNRKDFIYYLLMYRGEDGFDFERLSISDSRNETKTKFMLEDAALMHYLLETYQHSNSQQRKPVLLWFNKCKRPEQARHRCEQLSSLGKLSEKKRPFSWKTIGGRIDIESFILRVTKTIELTVRGLIICKIQIQESEDAKPVIKNRYFCMTKAEESTNEYPLFTNIYGPIITKVKGTPVRIFALNDVLLKNCT